jgi:hypothetical protein
MARAHFVKKARKDYPEANIKKGDSYYWWKFPYGGKQKSKTAPRPSQLTQSGYLGTIRDLVQDFSFPEYNTDDPTCIESEVEEVRSTLEELKEECESSLEEMPEQLRESSQAGELLQERIDALENAISELESIDSLDAEDIYERYQTARDEWEAENEPDEGEVQEAYSEAEADLIIWWEEKQDEVSDLILECDV